MGWRFVRSRPFSARSRRGVSLLVANCRRPGGCCTEWKGRAAQTDRASPGGLGALAPATRGPGLCGISCDRLDFVSITKDPETGGFAWARGSPRPSACVPPQHPSGHPPLLVSPLAGAEGCKPTFSSNSGQ